jgi:hypothetical protein
MSFGLISSSILIFDKDEMLFRTSSEIFICTDKKVIIAIDQ